LRFSGVNQAFRSENGNFAIVYFCCRAELSIDLSQIGAKKPLEAVWVGPQTGKRRSDGVFTDLSITPVTSPSWCDDALLLLREKE